MNKNQKKISELRLKILSNREKEILAFYRDGYSTKEIALKENRSFHTIKAINRNILKKANLNKMIKAISYFYAFEERNQHV